MKHLGALIIVVMCSIVVLPAQIMLPSEVLNNSNDLLAATVPIRYGDDAFRKRILARTNGERDPIGLVLSGGSARAFAHIGVLAYLEQEGIVPDFIIANSMGSVVGLLYAAGFSPQQIYALCSQIDIAHLFDLSLPIDGGFLDVSRFVSVVDAFLDTDVRVEELAIPIMVLNEDLATKRQVRIMEGDFSTVLAASFALPVYFSPVLYNGHLLIDGGFTNLVPLEAAYEYTDTVIVSTTFYEGKGLNLFSPLTILNTAIDIGKRRQGVQSLLDHPQSIWIRCDVEDFSFMDFSSIEKIAQRGYASAAEAKDALQALNGGTLTPEIVAVRSDFSARQAKTFSNYHLYGRVPQSYPSTQLFFGMRSFNYPGDQWYLRDDMLLGPMYSFRWRRLWFSLVGGMGWESSTPMAVYPSLTANLSYNPISMVLLDADVLLSQEEGWLPLWYYRLALHVRQRFFDEHMTITLNSWWENQLDNTFSLTSLLVHTGLAVDYHDGPSVVEAEAAWQLGGNYDRQFLHTSFAATFPVTDGHDLRTSYMGRYALDGKPDVPFYRGDGFRTASPAVLTQGWSEGEPNTSDRLIVGSVEWNYRPAGFAISAGELMHVHEAYVGGYANMLWWKEEQVIPDYSVGIQLGSTVSLLGLNSIGVSLYIGYENLTEGIVLGVQCEQ